MLREYRLLMTDDPSLTISFRLGFLLDKNPQEQKQILRGKGHTGRRRHFYSPPRCNSRKGHVQSRKVAAWANRTQKIRRQTSFGEREGMVSATPSQIYLDVPPRLSL